MWDLLAVNNGPHLDKVYFADFVAGWMIHDLEYTDLWIDRVAKVLRLQYYGLSVEDMTARVYAKLRASADMAERYQHPQAAEGERILAAQAPGPKNEAAGGDAHSAAMSLFSGSKPNVFLSDEDYAGKDPDEDAMVSDPEVNSSDLSESDNSQDTADSLAADEWEEKRRLERASAAEENSQMDMGQAVDTEALDLNTLAGFNALMEKPVIFFKMLGRGGDEQTGDEGAAVVKTKRKQKKRRFAAKNPKFQTDTLEVRIAIRTCFRAVSRQHFSLLVNWLVRVLRYMQSAANPMSSYLHEDDPVFRQLVTAAEAKELLVALGFVRLEPWWVWPRLHLPYACPPIE